MVLRAFSPHLSVVTTSRNDDHGGNLRERMQLFVDGLATQARRHRVALELVIVEWNPPPDRPPLQEALRWPAQGEFFEARILTVSPEIHARFDPHGLLPLFQMIAKNVGIRRARGRFILATNVDLLFPDELFRTLREGLREGLLYRNDRLDVAAQAPNDASFDQLMEYCRAHVLRWHRADGTFVPVGGQWVNIDPAAPRSMMGRLRRRLGWVWSAALAGAGVVGDLAARSVAGRETGSDGGTSRPLALFLRDLAERLGARWRLAGLHQNGCGDFTLLDRESWHRLRGYPEWVAFSWHLDSVFLFQADANRIPCRVLPEEQCAYHLEHGEGWTPEEQAGLFASLAKKGIRVLSHDELLRLREGMEEKRRQHRPVVYNEETWGLSDEDLPGVYPLGVTLATGEGPLPSL